MGNTILCLDDDPQTIKSLKELLEEECQIISCSNLEEAWELLIHKRVDAVISDATLKGNSTLDFFLKIQKGEQHFHQPYFLVYSDYEKYEAIIDQIMEVGFVDCFLPKPSPQKYLIQNLKKGISFYEDIQNSQLEHQRNLDENKELKFSNRSKDKFFSIIAHDLRSPFNSLLGLSEVLVEDADDLEEDEFQECVEKLHMTAVHLYDLLENLLLWARVQTDGILQNATEINLKPLILHNLALLGENANTKHVHLACDMDDDLKIYFDKFMISSVIQNLISNAVKFTPNGGEVKISGRMNNDQFVEVIISDNGVGIDHEDLGKLFQIDHPFSTYGTDDEKGTGLGLILCKEFIERNGGQIFVESEVGQGSRFSFTAPTFLMK